MGARSVATNPHMIPQPPETQTSFFAAPDSPRLCAPSSAFYQCLRTSAITTSAEQEATIKKGAPPDFRDAPERGAHVRGAAPKLFFKFTISIMCVRPENSAAPLRERGP